VPLNHEIDAELGIVFITLSGIIDEAAVFDFAESYLSGPVKLATRGELVDMRAVERLDFPTPVLRRLIAIEHRLGSAPRTAIVADKDAVFGVARMYQAMAESPTRMLRVFRIMADARAWLGLPASAVMRKNANG
jgi:hypothetical protein